MKYVLRAARPYQGPRLYDREFPVVTTYKHGGPHTEPTRQQVRSVACSRCGAATGSNCKRVSGDVRANNHRERVVAYKRDHAV